jgi:hypothetical protein
MTSPAKRVESGKVFCLSVHMITMSTVGPRPLSERRWVQNLKNGAAVTAMGLVLTSPIWIPTSLWLSDTWGLPAQVVPAQVTQKTHVPDRTEWVPVSDNKGMTTLTLRHYPDYFTVQVTTPTGVRQEVQVSEALYEELALGSPASVMEQHHRIGGGNSIEDVTFGRPRRRRP